MAAYTHLEEPLSPALPWLASGIGGFADTVQPSVAVLANGDGTFTRLLSSTNDLAYDTNTGTWSGNITSITRTNNIAGTIVFEQITGFSISAATFFAAGSPGASIALVLAGADTFTGWSGNDFFLGSPGADSYNGGSAGIDIVSYSNSAALVADLGAPANNTGDALGDTYVSIEGVGGGAGNDTLRGNGGANTLIGGDGNDFLRGRGGADFLDGGNGSDWADYFGGTALRVNLADPTNVTTGNTGDAVGDTYSSIEAIQGTDNNDTLIGDANPNNLRGRGGADILDGGDGSDYADYGTDTLGIRVSLADTLLNTGEAIGDTFTSIENLRGGDGVDTLIGDGNTNFLAGGPGGDSLEGGASGDYASYRFAATGVRADVSSS
jgi:Ca2+-binding RTX toxin-like protein